ncbi:MAG TPA: glycosyltransferase [Polyangia bacterium]|nr:glycosyltransferase [Polyangia bacterium]
MTTTRCDLHVHSSASTGNDEWYTRVFGCPESYADPVRQYELCKARGMSLVTLTDHDTIAGALTLVDRPDFFISEEVTAVFPENGCVMHVLTWNITPAQHDKIQSVRDNIYDLCDYLNREQIAHGLAHPLLSPNWRLDAELFEKLILLFPTMEGINGLVDRRIEPDLFTILDRLTPEVVAALSRKHGLLARGATPARKALVAGSDDHVHRRCGTIFSEIEGQHGPEAFLGRCLDGEARLNGEQAHLNTMAVCIKHTTYHHLKERGAERGGFYNPFVEMMDLIAGRQPRDCGKGKPSGPDSPLEGFVASLFSGLRSADVGAGKQFDILEVPARATEEDDARIVGCASQVANKVIERAFSDLLDGLNDFDLYGVFGACRDVAGALVTAAPMFFAAHHFGRQERQSVRVWNEWDAFPLPDRPDRLALFSDSLEHVDGVSTWCTRFADRARAAQQEVLVPHCGGVPHSLAEGAPPLHRLPAITSFTLPLYDQLRFYLPSLIDTLVWTWQERITHVELATPGPMGLVGLLIAKVLQLPVTASYHTEVPALINLLGGPPMLERAGRSYLGWFYSHVDRVFAFSSTSRDRLVGMGVRPESIHLVPQTVDPTEFSPNHRSDEVFDELNVAVGDRPVILSVGRISQEKNVPLMISAVEALQRRPNPPLLLVVGDGPERRELEDASAGKDFVRFVGTQRGQVLRRLYASADMFVFASRVDTLGLVNMEAMSSGIPVLVPADAGIAEFVTKGISAECYPFGREGLIAAIERVLDDPSHAERIGAAGRAAMVARWESASFSRLWETMVQ